MYARRFYFSYTYNSTPIRFIKKIDFFYYEMNVSDLIWLFL